MRALFAKLISDKAGVTAIEYGLIAALIVIGALVAINSVGLALNLSNTFSMIASKLWGVRSSLNGPRPRCKPAAYR